MDIEYIKRREQVSLHNAFVAASMPARIAHEGLAAAYGVLLANIRSARRRASETYGPAARDVAIGGWENEGGSIRLYDRLRGRITPSKGRGLARRQGPPS